MAVTKRGKGGSESGNKTRTEGVRASTAGSRKPRIRSSHGGASTSGSRAESAGSTLPRPPRSPARPAAAAKPKTRKAAAKPESDVSLASDAARSTATAIAVAALDKKAIGLEILDVAGKVDYADFLVLMTGRSDRQVVALSQGIEEALRQQGKRPLSVEGLPHARWVLMDFGDVVVHVFQEDARGLYDLEGLWMDARRLPVPASEDELS